jgi:hypothetical protein
MKYVKLMHINTVRAKGRIYHYHRKTKERLPDDPIVRAERVLAINASLGTKDSPKSPGSMASLIAAYKASPEFRKLAVKTRKDYLRYLSYFEVEFGGQLVSGLDAEAVLDIRDLFAETPRKADYMVQVLSLLCSYALKRPRTYKLTHNPCQRIERIHETEGNLPWPDNVIEDFLKAAYPELRWIALAGLYLGQRGQDDTAMTWHACDRGAVEVVQQKTGKPLTIPLHPVMADLLETIPRRALVIFTTKTGRPWKLDHLRHEIKRVLTAIGHPGYSRHGLRKNAVNNLLEAGCSEKQAGAVTGLGPQMIEHYSRRADQKRLAEQAIRKLIKNERRTWGR